MKRSVQMLLGVSLAVVVSLSGISPAGGGTTLVHGGWESLGGGVVGKPAVSSWGPGRLDVFVRGTDDALHHRWYEQGWSGWESLGMPVTAAGAGLASEPAAVAWGAGRIDVFVKGKDGALWHKWYDRVWSGWESLGGVLTAAPAVSSWAPNRLDVFVRGSDNAMYHKWWAPGWSGWESLGGVLDGGPAAVSWGPGRIDVFARGTDNGLYQRWFDGAAWRGWLGQGGQLSADPGVSSWGPNRLDVFVRGTDNAVYHKTYANAWQGFVRTGPTTVSSGLAAVSWAVNRIDVFARADDGTLGHDWLLPQASFSFGDGTWRVGADVPAKTYRLRRFPSVDGCYFERLRGWSGGIDDIIANGLTVSREVVTILPSDAGFHSDGCGTWTDDLSALTASPTSPFGDGTWIVGTDIAAGTWSAAGGPSCYWARLKSFLHTDYVIADHYGPSNPSVSIQPGDAGFFTDSCGTWTRSP